MRKGFLKLALAGFLLVGFAGNDILMAQANRIELLTNQQFSLHKAEHYAVFSANSDYSLSGYADAFDKAVALKLNKASLASIYNNKPETLTFTVPTPEGTLTVNLYQYDFFTADFKAYKRVENGTLVPVDYRKGAYYRGYVGGISPSMVTFSFFENDAVGIISTKSNGNYNVIAVPHEGYGTDKFMVFNDVDIKNKEQHFTPCETDNAFNLGTGEGIIPQGTPTATSSNGYCREVTVSLHADYRAYQRNNNNIAQTENYLTTLMNANSTLYANDGMILTLKEMVVNSVQDNYPTSSSTAVLNRFGSDIGTNLTADLHQMITGYRRNGYPPLGGLAWLDVLCATPRYISQRSTYWGPYSMTNNSSVTSAIQPVPVYSWDVNASSHEMGHNLGSHHTHWCGWPGGAIDGCTTLEPDDNNNGCATPVPQYPVNGGTIMSYCHLVSTGINLNNGFGPLPGTLLRTKIAGAGCVTGKEARKILDVAGQTVTATHYCDDGEYYLFYYDNATATETDDQMIFALKKSDVPNIDLNSSTFSMTTTGSYGSGDPIAISSAYKPYASWTEGNRYWTINIQPAPQDTVSFKVPVLVNDLNELQSNLNISRNQIQLMIFNNANAAANINSATPSNVRVYNYTSNGNPGTWFMPSVSTGADYNWVLGRSDRSTYGIRFGYGSGATGIDEMESAGVNIFPNPALDRVFLQFSNVSDNYKVKIVDALGRTVYTNSNIGKQQQVEISTSQWAAGMYTVILDTDRNTYTSRIIKQ